MLALLLSSCTPPYDEYMKEGKDFRNKNSFDKAQASFHKAVLEAKKITKPDKKEKLIAAILAEVEADTMVHKNDDALRLLSEAVTVAENSNDDKQGAKLRKQMADLNCVQEDFNEAKNNYTLAYEHIKTLGQEKSELACEILAGLGDLYKDKDNKTALKYYESANKTLTTAAGRDMHFQVSVLHKLAYIYEALHRENDAIDCEEQAKSLEMTSVGNRIDGMPALMR